MDTMFRRSKLSVMLLGIAETILGIYCFMNPAGATVTVVQVMGWILIFVGGVTLASCLMGTASTASFLAGGAQLVFGLLMAIRPDIFVSYVFVLLGIMVIVTGIHDLTEVGQLRDNGTRVGLGMGIVTIALGAFMLAAPFFFADMIAIVAGIGLVVSGVTEVLAGVQMA